MAVSVWNSEIFKEGAQDTIAQNEEPKNAKDRMIYATDFKGHKFGV